MSNWTAEDLYRLDLEYAKEGVHLHQRPFRAARELLGSAFALGMEANSEADKIMRTYAQLVLEVSTTWPGAGIGLAVSVDRVRKLTLPVEFGHPAIEPWKATGFETVEEWREWCRGQSEIASASYFAFADLYDFAY